MTDQTQRHSGGESQSWLASILRFDLPSSIVVFFVALPLCMGIAQASGAPISAGIITGIVGGLIVGAISGSPLQISGPAAGLIAVVLGVVQEHGLAALGIVVLLAGLIQLTAGLLKLGQWFRAVSPAVIRGMLTGIGVIIVASQIHVMVDGASKGSPLENIMSIPGAIINGNHWAAMLGLLAIGTILLWQTATPKRWRLIPGPLLALLVTAGAAFALSLPVSYIVVPENLMEGIRFPSLEVVGNMPITSLIFWTLTFALIASAEALLCASAIDQMHTGAQSRFDRELTAQGAGNMICGVLGALPITGLIVRSSTNVQSGAKSRVSGMLHGTWLLLFVVLLGGLLQHIPTSVLAAILVYVGSRLIDFKALKEFRAYGWGEVGIFVGTVAGIVVWNVLAGVLLGIVLAGIKLLLGFTKLTCRPHENADGSRRLELIGTGSFVGLPKLATALESVPGGATLHLDLTHLRHLDPACGQLLTGWTRQHRAQGGEVQVDWNSLHGDLHNDFAPAEKLRHVIERERPEPALAG